MLNNVPGAVYETSVNEIDGVTIAMARDDKEKFLIIGGNTDSPVFKDFAGNAIDGKLKKAPLNADNAAALRKHFPWTAPVSLRDRKTTVGCGDRLGLASVGHIAAVKQFQATPVLAQQSMRELDMTGRTYRQVVDDTAGTDDSAMP